MEAYLFSIAAHKLTDHLRKQGRRPIDQFGSDDHGRPLEEVPGGARPASSIAPSGERREAEEPLLTHSVGQLAPQWRAQGALHPLPRPGLVIRPAGSGRAARPPAPADRPSGPLRLAPPPPPPPRPPPPHRGVTAPPSPPPPPAPLSATPAPPPTPPRTRHNRILQSSRHLLGDE